MINIDVLTKISPKAYIVNRDLKKVMPDNKFAYTIELYNHGNMSDSIYAITSHFSIYHRTYTECMKAKFDCVEHNSKLFFKTKEDCQEAIEFIEAIQIVNKLIN